MSNSILVVGGGGYIGSHMVRHLAERSLPAAVLDDFSTGYRDALLGAELLEGDLGDAATLDRALGSGRFGCVMHFASFIQVGESVGQPAKYYANNVANTIALLNAMARHGVRRFIFSSSAAVYGEPERVPIPEDHPTRPVNPYGRTKLIVEEMLPDYARAYGLQWAALRYFNAAGADPAGRLGERHEPETHLIPLALRACSGRLAKLTVFGEDWPTPDGTCIRDYVHVSDLCDAHLLALRHLEAGGESRAFNLGNGGGFSVRQVIDAARRVSGREPACAFAARRPGDAAVLVADATAARTVLGWKPRFDALDTIVAHAWAWEKKMAGLA